MSSDKVVDALTRNHLDAEDAFKDARNLKLQTQ